MKPNRQIYALGLLLLALSRHELVTAAGLGRLFTTPEERANLDTRRNSLANGPAPASAGAGDPAAQPAAAPPPPPPPDVVLNGVVRRQGGRSTVWINEVAQDATTLPLRPHGGVTLRLSSGRQLILQPGQRYNPTEGMVHESGH